MKKNNMLVIFCIILLIALIIMTLMYFNMRKTAKQNFDYMLKNAEETYKANKRISELEEELEKYKNSNIITDETNTLNTPLSNSNNTDNSTLSEPYIPDEMKVANTDEEFGTKASDIELNRKPENVKIEILENSITNKSIDILITDNNEDSYGWGKAYRIQKNEKGVWKDLKPIKDLSFEEIAYSLDNNNQLKQKIDWSKLYGELENGIYRIVKPIYDKQYIDLYSNEFEIK